MPLIVLRRTAAWPAADQASAAGCNCGHWSVGNWPDLASLLGASVQRCA